MRYIIVAWHGESKTLFYLVDTVQEIVLETFHNRGDAEHYKQWINDPKLEVRRLHANADR